MQVCSHFGLYVENPLHLTLMALTGLVVVPLGLVVGPLFQGRWRAGCRKLGGAHSSTPPGVTVAPTDYFKSWGFP